MQTERTIYTKYWFYEQGKSLFLFAGRCLAFGLLMFLSFVFLAGLPILFYLESPQVFNVTVGVILGLVCGMCTWWIALKTAEENYSSSDYEKDWTSLFRNNDLKRNLLSEYLQKEADRKSTSLVLSRDIDQAAHNLLDESDEMTKRIIVAAMLESRKRNSIPIKQKIIDEASVDQQSAGGDAH